MSPTQKYKPFDTTIWKRTSVERRKRREKKRLQTIEEVDRAIRQLCRTYEWEELYLFGSVSKPERFGEYSDIDIGIKGLDKFLHFRFISDLSGLLDRPVDVVRLEDCSFADPIKKRGIQWKKKK